MSKLFTFCIIYIISQLVLLILWFIFFYLYSVLAFFLIIESNNKLTFFKHHFEGHYVIKSQAKKSFQKSALHVCLLIKFAYLKLFFFAYLIADHWLGNNILDFVRQSHFSSHIYLLLNVLKIAHLLLPW